MNFADIENLINYKKATLLCVGPMSKNFVDTSINLSNKKKFPLILIASRRQIDSKLFGGGYVNNWDTEEFSKYVKKKDKKNTIFLARDHGGPYQNDLEIKKKMKLNDAIKSCKESYKVDIINDFKFIHIDPSLEVFEKLSLEKIIEIICDLMEFCWNIAKKYNKEIYFEIGTEEQSAFKNDIETTEYVLNKIDKFSKKNKIDFPKFIVVQTGTKVFKNRNIGTFDTPIRVKNELPIEVQMPLVNKLCNKFKIFVKEHNVDYLSEESLKWHPSLEIHAANVAPEFGLVETKTILKYLKLMKMNDEYEKFANLCLISKKWKKWVENDIKETSDELKILLSGHYLFSSNEFLEIYKKLEKKTKNKNIDLGKEISNNLEITLHKYISNFRIVR